jgi:hypothetical protein
VIATFEISARFLTRPYLKTDSHDLADGKIAADGTTFEGVKLTFRAT